jgi:hypothetical protein
LDYETVMAGGYQRFGRTCWLDLEGRILFMEFITFIFIRIQERILQ